MFRLALTIVSLLGSLDIAAAARVLEDVENSAELALSQIALPPSATGMITFKACASCELSRHRLTAATTYFANGAELRFADFLRTVDEIDAHRGGREQTLVGVFFDVQSGHVTRIALHSRAR